uniref:Sex hormone binding globulin n=1 Tax=Equus caballus TaxID=9796 RepID=A0A9L0SP64_HORSE
MESRGPLATLPQWLPLLLLLLLPLPHSPQGLALRYFFLPRSLLFSLSPCPSLSLNSTFPHPTFILKGHTPCTVLLLCPSRTSSSFESRTRDPEGMIIYGDTNPKDDWFGLGLRDGRQAPGASGSASLLLLQVDVKILGDSVLLGVGGEEVLCWTGLWASGQQTPAHHEDCAGGLLLPASNLQLPLVKHCWLGDHGGLSPPSAPTSLRTCAVDLEASGGSFLPPDIPKPHAETWAFSLDLGLQLAAGSSHFLALGSPENPSWLSFHLQDQKVVLSSRLGPGLDPPLVLGLPLQLKLAVSRVVLNQGPKKEILVLLPLGVSSLLNLWLQLQGCLFLGTFPGEDSSASFCLDSLWAPGQRLDMDRALSRSQDIRLREYLCPQRIW